MIFGVVGIADWSHVLVVDQSVAVEVHVTDVAQCGPVGRVGVIGAIGELLVGVEEAVADQSETLPDREAGLVHPGVGVLGLGFVDDLVPRIAHVAAERIAPVADLVFPRKKNFVTLVLRDADVYRRNLIGTYAVNDRDGSERGEDIATIFAEIVGHQRQTVAEEAHLQSHVVFLGPLPGNVGIADYALGGSRPVGILR